MGIYLLF
jgi:hypothetical protein